MKFYKLLHQGKANIATLVGAALLAFDAMEAFKQTRYSCPRNANARILDTQLGMPVYTRKRTTISPSNVNLKALEKKVKHVFSHISRST